MYETNNTAEIAELSTETFLEDTRLTLERFYASSQQREEFAQIGQQLYKAPGYLERLYAAESDTEVTLADRLVDAYASGIVLDMPEVTEKAELLLRGMYAESALARYLSREVSTFMGKERTGQGKYGNVRYARLEVERAKLDARLEENRRRDKQVRQQEKAANPREGVLLKVANAVGGTVLAKAFKRERA